MDPDREICLCFHVSQRKVVNYLRREQPKVASQLSECLGAGTGCGWCRSTLERLWNQVRDGEEPGIEETEEAYAEARRAYQKARRRARSEEDSAQGE